MNPFNLEHQSRTIDRPVDNRRITDDRFFGTASEAAALVRPIAGDSLVIVREGAECYVAATIYCDDER